ncbi:Homeobox domain-containing protein [Psidium guajava]|nr:Homeobox domain-containing protein [Psidium guajava]
MGEIIFVFFRSHLLVPNGSCAVLIPLDATFPSFAKDR